MLKTSEQQKLSEFEQKLATLRKGRRACHESQVSNAIETGLVLLGAKALLGKGRFGKWCSTVKSLESSQRNVYARLAAHKDDLKEAQVWAVENGIPATSVSDCYKLLPKWKRRNDPSSSLVLETGKKSVSSLNEEQRMQISAAHAIWSDRCNESEDIDHAELFLHRLAEACNVRIGRLLKEVSLKVPHSWIEKIQTEAFVPSCVIAEGSLCNVIDVDIAPFKPSIEVDQATSSHLISSGATEVAPSDNAASASCDKQEMILPGDNSKLSTIEHKSIPALFSAITGRRASRSNCQKGLNTIIDLDRAGMDAAMIAAKLKEQNLDAKPPQIEKILARARNVYSNESGNAIAA